MQFTNILFVLPVFFGISQAIKIRDDGCQAKVLPDGSIADCDSITVITTIITSTDTHQVSPTVAVWTNDDVTLTTTVSNAPPAVTTITSRSTKTFSLSTSFTTIRSTVLSNPPTPTPTPSTIILGSTSTSRGPSTIIIDSTASSTEASPTTTTSAAAEAATGGGTSAGLVIGLPIGLTAVIAVAVLLFLYFRKRRTPGSSGQSLTPRQDSKLKQSILGLGVPTSAQLSPAEPNQVFQDRRSELSNINNQENGYPVTNNSTHTQYNPYNQAVPGLRVPVATRPRPISSIYSQATELAHNRWGHGTMNTSVLNRAIDSTMHGYGYTPDTMQASRASTPPRTPPAVDNVNNGDLYEHGNNVSREEFPEFRHSVTSEYTDVPVSHYNRSITPDQAHDAVGRPASTIDDGTRTLHEDERQAARERAMALLEGRDVLPHNSNRDTDYAAAFGIRNVESLLRRN